MKTFLLSSFLLLASLAGSFAVDRMAEMAAAAKLYDTVLADKRRPTSKNISGSWNTPTDMTGYTLHLLQQDERVTGQGFHWGCFGIDSPFKVSGTYRNGVLSLVFIERGEAPKRMKFKRTLEDKKLRLNDIDPDSRAQLLPYLEVRRLGDPEK